MDWRGECTGSPPEQVTHDYSNQQQSRGHAEDSSPGGGFALQMMPTPAAAAAQDVPQFHWPEQPRSVPQWAGGQKWGQQPVGLVATGTSTSENIAITSHEGFLSKLSPKKGGGWQRRWFVLDGPAGTLSYFKEKDAKTMFLEMDSDKSGYLDMKEVETLCKQLGKKLSKKELTRAFTDLDSDGNNQVSYEEFEVWWKIHNAKQAGKREAAGTIELKVIKSVLAIGSRELRLVYTAGRLYDLMADTSADASKWFGIIRQNVPSIAREEQQIEQRRALRAALGGQATAAKVEITLERLEQMPNGPNGLSWMPLHHDGKEYALVQSVFPGSPAAVAGVQQHALLGFVDAVAAVGYTFRDIMATVLNQRPVKLGFLMQVDEGSLRQLIVQTEPALPLHKGKINLQWAGSSGQSQSSQAKYCVLDCRGLHYFGNERDAVTNPQGQIDKNNSDGTVDLKTMSILPLQASTAAGWSLQLATGQPDVTVVLGLETFSQLEGWVLALCTAVQNTTGIRPDAADQLIDIMPLDGEDDNTSPLRALPWGAPKHYKCVKMCQVRANYSEPVAQIVAILAVGELVKVLEHVETDRAVNIRLRHRNGQCGWVQVADAESDGGACYLQPVEAADVEAVAEAADARAAAAAASGQQEGKYEGYLGKLSPKKGGGWQRRWFVLDGPAGTLSYFKEKDAKTMFLEMDSDKSGYLDMKEVETLCKQLGKKLSKKELTRAFTDLDSDGNNQVSYEEFEVWWKIHNAKQAGKREAAGSINLFGVANITLDGLVLSLAESGRTYQLQADTAEQARAWYTRACAWSPAMLEEKEKRVAAAAAALKDAPFSFDDYVQTKIDRRVGTIFEARTDDDGAVHVRIEFMNGELMWRQAQQVEVAPDHADEQLSAVIKSRKKNANAPSNEGFLSKLSPKKGGGWQRRWFVLDGPAGTLSYFKEKDAKTMFLEMDSDKSGYLDMKEVETLCKQLGKKLSKKELTRAFTDLDSDGNNQVSYEEFEVWWKIHNAKQAGKREAAGGIDLHSVMDLRQVGELITVVTSTRTYELQAETTVGATTWVKALRGSAPVLAAKEEAKAQAKNRLLAGTPFMLGLELLEKATGELGILTDVRESKKGGGIQAEMSFSSGAQPKWLLLADLEVSPETAKAAAKIQAVHRGRASRFNPAAKAKAKAGSMAKGALDKAQALDPTGMTTKAVQLSSAATDRALAATMDVGARAAEMSNKALAMDPTGMASRAAALAGDTLIASSQLATGDFDGAAKTAAGAAGKQLQLAELTAKAIGIGNVVALATDTAGRVADKAVEVAGVVSMAGPSTTPVSPLLELTRELEQLRMTELRKRALQQTGVTEAEVDDAEDSDTPKQALVELIVRLHREKEAQTKLAEAELRAELGGFRLSELRRRANAEGVADADLEEAEDSDNPKLAITSLILQQVSLEAELIATAPLPPPPPPDKMDRLQMLRLELTGMKWTDLEKRAQAVGVDSDTLDTAQDSEEPKHAIVEVILQRERELQAARPQALREAAVDVARKEHRRNALADEESSKKAAAKATLAAAEGELDHAREIAEKEAEERRKRAEKRKALKAEAAATRDAAKRSSSVRRQSVTALRRQSISHFSGSSSSGEMDPITAAAMAAALVPADNDVSGDGERETEGENEEKLSPTAVRAAKRKERRASIAMTERQIEVLQTHVLGQSDAAGAHGEANEGKAALWAKVDAEGEISKAKLRADALAEAQYTETAAARARIAAEQRILAEEEAKAAKEEETRAARLKAEEAYRQEQARLEEETARREVARQLVEAVHVAKEEAAAEAEQNRLKEEEREAVEAEQKRLEDEVAAVKLQTEREAKEAKEAEDARIAAEAEAQKAADAEAARVEAEVKRIAAAAAAAEQLEATRLAAEAQIATAQKEAAKIVAEATEAVRRQADEVARNAAMAEASRIQSALVAARQEEAEMRAQAELAREKAEAKVGAERLAEIRAHALRAGAKARAIKYDTVPEHKQDTHSQELAPPVVIGTPWRRLKRPARAVKYFSAEVFPTLQRALAALHTKRPNDPVRFLGEFFLRAGEKVVQPGDVAGHAVNWTAERKGDASIKDVDRPPTLDYLQAEVRDALLYGMLQLNKGRPLDSTTGLSPLSRMGELLLERSTAAVPAGPVGEDGSLDSLSGGSSVASD